MERLEVFIHEFPLGMHHPPSPGAASELFEGVLRLCISTSAPATKNLWIWTRCDDGKLMGRQEDWATYEQIIRPPRAAAEGPWNLAPGRFEGPPEHRKAAEELIGKLGEAFPSQGFSLDWNTQRLHVFIHNFTIGVPPGAGSNTTQELFRGVIKLCLSTPALATNELWISVRDETGHIGGERGDWEGYESYESRR